MIVYATEADLSQWTGLPQSEDNAVALRKASALVGRACRLDLYATQPDGRPRDDDLREAMRDATCAQVETWIGSGVDVVAGVGGQAPRPTVSAIDGAQVSFDTYLTNEARDRSIDTLCAESADILRSAGLASAAV